MGKKSRKQRTALRKKAQSSTAERLEVAPTSATVAAVPGTGAPSSPPEELIRHPSGIRQRVERSRSTVLDGLVASDLGRTDADGDGAREGAPAPKPVQAPEERVHVEEEHRVSPRVSLAVDIHLSSPSHFFSGLSGDISEGGLFLSTYRALPIGSIVELEFTLPGSDRPLYARGEVRWVREHSAFGPRGVGIAFGALAADDRRRIHEFCAVRPALYYDDLG